MAKLSKTKIKKYLKDKGHNKNRVDEKNMDNEENIIKSLLELHGINIDEYKVAGGKKISE